MSTDTRREVTAADDAALARIDAIEEALGVPMHPGWAPESPMVGEHLAVVFSTSYNTIRARVFVELRRSRDAATEGREYPGAYRRPLVPLPNIVLGSAAKPYYGWRPDAVRAFIRAYGAE